MRRLVCLVLLASRCGRGRRGPSLARRRLLLVRLGRCAATGTRHLKLTDGERTSAARRRFPSASFVVQASARGVVRRPARVVSIGGPCSCRTSHAGGHSPTCSPPRRARAARGPGGVPETRAPAAVPRRPLNLSAEPAPVRKLVVHVVGQVYQPGPLQPSGGKPRRRRDQPGGRAAAKGRARAREPRRAGRRRPAGRRSVEPGGCAGRSPEAPRPGSGRARPPELRHAGSARRAARHRACDGPEDPRLSVRARRVRLGGRARRRSGHRPRDRSTSFGTSSTCEDRDAGPGASPSCRRAVRGLGRVARRAWHRPTLLGAVALALAAVRAWRDSPVRAILLWRPRFSSPAGGGAACASTPSTGAMLRCGDRPGRARACSR